MRAEEMTDTGHGQVTPEYETKEQLAQRLGISGRTVNNLMRRGLPYIRLGGKLLRFPKAIVDAWMAGQIIKQ